MIWTPERKEKALAECHAWHGTRHVNRLAIKGVGIDCVQFVWKVLAAAEIVPFGFVPPYSTEEGLFSPSDKLQRVICHVLHHEIAEVESSTFGDVVLFKTGGRTAHCGFFADGEVWHSLAGRCVTRSPWLLWRRKADLLIRVTETGFKNEPYSTVKKYER